MGVVHEIPNTKAKILLNVPEQPTKEAILFVPGISGGAFSERYQPLVEAALQSGFALARFSSWEGEGAVDAKTPAEVFAEIDGAIQLLRDAGYERVAGVGKSFGGGMMLAHVQADLFAKVLWAPAIGFTHGASNIQAQLSLPFSSLNNLLSLTLNQEYLSVYSGKICFIHGTADNAIPFDNSVRIQAAVLNSILVPIEGADHSYRDKAHEAQVIEETLKFIK